MGTDREGRVEIGIGGGRVATGTGGGGGGRYCFGGGGNDRTEIEEERECVELPVRSVRTAAKEAALAGVLGGSWGVGGSFDRTGGGGGISRGGSFRRGCTDVPGGDLTSA